MRVRWYTREVQGAPRQKVMTDLLFFWISSLLSYQPMANAYRRRMSIAVFEHFEPFVSPYALRFRLVPIITQELSSYTKDHRIRIAISRDRFFPETAPSVMIFQYFLTTNVNPYTVARKPSHYC